MLLGKPQDPSRMIRVGMFSLVVGALSLRLLPRVPHMNPDLADGVAGLFYGIAIAAMLVGIRARSRRKPV